MRWFLASVAALGLHGCAAVKLETSADAEGVEVSARVEYAAIGEALGLTNTEDSSK